MDGVVVRELDSDLEIHVEITTQPQSLLGDLLSTSPTLQGCDDKKREGTELLGRKVALKM